MPRRPLGRRRFAWLDARTLWRSRNEPLARWLGDPSPVWRERWLREWHGEPPRDPRIDRRDLGEYAFVLLGDTGEGDLSQYALLPVLEAAAADTAFMVICSDVIYPGGEAEEYLDKFFHPYSGYHAAIHALPGNHDWYDGLGGFMFHFCGRERAPRRTRPPFPSRAWLRDLLWRKAGAPPDPLLVAAMRALRPHPSQHSRQPGPYYVIETGPLDLVAIDTGIVSGLDRTQGEWLRRVSRSPRPKILLTGRPLIVDGRRRPCPIEGGGSVDDIVRDPGSNYLAAIGGDVHNYQRYAAAVGGRTVQYVVSGGGGAYSHATHKIPDIDTAGIEGVSEADFRCYPLRGDSLSFYSGLWDRTFPGDWYIAPAQAAAYMAERLGMRPTKVDVPPVTAQTRRRGRRVFPLPGRGRGPLHAYFSELFDWNHPPLFKHLLRVDVASDRIAITCHAATGCEGDHRRAPEDELVCRRGADGAWRWDASAPT